MKTPAIWLTGLAMLFLIGCGKAAPQGAMTPATDVSSTSTPQGAVAAPQGNTPAGAYPTGMPPEAQQRMQEMMQNTGSLGKSGQQGAGGGAVPR
jgi:hypothetical protein